MSIFPCLTYFTNMKSQRLTHVVTVAELGYFFKAYTPISQKEYCLYVCLSVCLSSIYLNVCVCVCVPILVYAPVYVYVSMGGVRGRASMAWNLPSNLHCLA